MAKVEYRLVEEFPRYAVDREANVIHIEGGYILPRVRVTKTGVALVNLRKDGKIYTRPAVDLRDAAFGVVE